MTEPVAEPLWKGPTRRPGWPPFKRGWSELHRALETPPGTEVEVWPAGSRPVPVTREEMRALLLALRDAYRTGDWDRLEQLLGWDPIPGEPIEVRLLLRQSPTEESSDGA